MWWRLTIRAVSEAVDALRRRRPMEAGDVWIGNGP
uniref:Uncharacterized protein n=1 Tax=Arundo donax TaxID=35708 RepID=A0A0A8YRN6_ARUDO